VIIFAALVGGAFASLPSWLPQAGLGFVEGFLSDKSTDVPMCIVGVLAPLADIKNGLADIKMGIKERNLTDIEEGVESLRQVMQDLPSAMQKCKAAEADVKAIVAVLKGFHSIHDIINHIKSDLSADSSGAIAQEFELMVRSFEAKKYDDFGKYLGEMLHRLIVGPEGNLVSFVRACSGSDDPKGPFPACYEGKAGALGVTEDVKVKLTSYASGKGTMDITGSGIEAITCTGKSFTKSGQTISPDLGSCLPSVITIKSVEYCSDTDTVYVTVKDKSIFFPVSATLNKVTCPSSEVLV